MMADVLHSEYPHTPGYLYDCPGCESACYCTGTDYAPCVWCESEYPFEKRDDE